MLYSNLDVKTPYAARVREDKTREDSSEKAIGSEDGFDLSCPQSRVAAILNVKAPKQVSVGDVWWDQRLIDALPALPTFTDLPELDERSKEALRFLAEAAPHRNVDY